MNAFVKLVTSVLLAASLSGCYVATVRTGYYSPNYVSVDDAWYDYPYYVTGGVYYYYHPVTRTVVYRSPKILVRQHHHRQPVIEHRPHVIHKEVRPYVAPTYERPHVIYKHKEVQKFVAPRHEAPRTIIREHREPRVERQFKRDRERDRERQH